MLNYIYNHLDFTHFVLNNDAILLVVVSSFIDDTSERISRSSMRRLKKKCPTG
jgi:hypothetical protein